MFIKIAPLWQHQSKKGTQFLTGRLNLQHLLETLKALYEQDPTRPIRVAVFTNTRRRKQSEPPFTLTVYGELQGKRQAAVMVVPRGPVKYH